jgi:hypothetical protein
MFETISGWLGALKLPTRVVFGMFLFGCTVLVLDAFGMVPLSELGPFGWTLVFVATLFFGCLFAGAVGEEGYLALKRALAERKIWRRRQARVDEDEAARAKFREKVLKGLNYLTRSEHRILADCLRADEQSFQAWVHSSDVQSLMARHLVKTPGAMAHGDHYPFYVTDYVWDDLLARREEFLAKDDENKRREAEERRQEQRRRGY